MSISSYLPAKHYEQIHNAAFSPKEIEGEIALLTIGERKVFDRLCLFACTYFKSLLHTNELQVIEYLEGLLKLRDLEITQENAHSVLKIVKLIDMAISWYARAGHGRIKFKRSTDKIRTRILEACSPNMTTAEAYTKTLNREKMCSFAHLQNPSSWTATRNGHHAKWIANVCCKAIALANRIKDPTNALVVSQGNTAAGKTTALKEALKHAVDDNGDLIGTLNPDHCKALVKHTGESNGCRLTNSQAYYEGTAIFENYFPEMLQKAMSVVLDRRFGLQTAMTINKPVSCIDVDVPLRTSLVRNLVRDPFGNDPCVVLDAVTTGFMQVRQFRANMITTIQKNPNIKQYKLYYTNELGKRQLIAKKESDVLSILSEESFKECIRIPSAKEVENVSKQIITKEFVDSAIGIDIPQTDKYLLERWIGYSIAEAIEQTAAVTLPTTLIRPELPGKFELELTTDGYEDREQLIRVNLNTYFNGKDNETKRMWANNIRSQPLQFLESVTFRSTASGVACYQLILTRLSKHDFSVSLQTEFEGAKYVTSSQKKQFISLKKYLKQFGVDRLASETAPYYLISGTQNTEKFLTQFISFGYLEPFVLDLIRVPSFRDYLERTQPNEIIHHEPAEVWFKTKEILERVERLQSYDKTCGNIENMFMTKTQIATL